MKVNSTGDQIRDLASDRDSMRDKVFDLPVSRVSTWFCEDVIGVLASTEAALERRTIVTVPWKIADRLPDALDRAVERIARAAATRWPFRIDDAPSLQHRDETQREWLRRAHRNIACGGLPIPQGFPNEIHVRQLIETFRAEEPVVGFVFDEEEAHDAELLCFARAAEWLAIHAGVRLIAFVPSRYRDRDLLSSITYNSDIVDEPREDPRSRDLTGGREPVLSSPLIGQPHPDSPGENLLARVLQSDDELRGLFKHNQWAEAGRDERFLVDLLWSAGRFVVEVDGYGWHMQEAVFRSDRYRDYCLMIAGYRVLRLPHDEVMADAALQVDKIRDVVRFIRSREEAGTA